MSRTTYHVIACIDGRFDVVGDTPDPNETVSQVADRAYNGQPYRSVHVGESHDADIGETVPPECEVHRFPMVWVDKNGGFWSCHKKNPDGSWCSYRPPQ